MENFTPEFGYQWNAKKIEDFFFIYIERDASCYKKGLIRKIRIRYKDAATPYSLSEGLYGLMAFCLSCAQLSSAALFPFLTLRTDFHAFFYLSFFPLFFWKFVLFFFFFLFWNRKCILVNNMFGFWEIEIENCCLLEYF